ncbi:MAG: hypothetical protein QOD71_455 [Thermoleophilaceae bacterium]|jgi:hypothetical protein|nr:hypothetical protein [Thermoleophilaceae bacterium]
MFASDDFLGPLLDAAEVSGEELGEVELRRLWALTGVDDGRFEEFVEVVLPRSGDELAFRAGSWRIDLREAGVRTGLLTALVAGVLIPQGMSEFAIGFVTAVLPSVLEIERVELSQGDRRLLVELRARTSLGSPDELYAALPPETRAVINPYDFADFIQRLRDAGLAEGPAAGPIQLRPPQ